MTSAKIIVCSLDALTDVVTSASADHLVSLINDQMMPDTPATLADARHLKLPMNDIEVAAPGYVTPSARHVEQLADFALGWNQSNPMVIHCWAGISRSTAAAFITLCVLNPDMCEREIARLIRKRSATATPNGLLVSCADQVLGRSGRMVRAIQEIGRGEDASEGRPFSLATSVRETER